MTSTQTAAGRTGVKPGEQAPDLVVDLVGGGSWDLAAQQPQGFTLVVFYRGYHCPVCRAQLSELNRRIDELEQRGLSVIAVSGDSEELASQSTSDWHLDRLTIGYGLPERSMRAWGLFVSAGHDGEPERFNEPGLFLVKPDGSVYYEALSSMPWGAPTSTTSSMGSTTSSAPTTPPAAKPDPAHSESACDTSLPNPCVHVKENR